MATFDDIPGFKFRPHPPHDSALYATAVASVPGVRDPRRDYSCSRTSRFNVARPPSNSNTPIQSLWLAKSGYVVPSGHRPATASSETSGSLSATVDSGVGPLHSMEIGQGGNPECSPIYSAGLCSRADSLTLVAPRSANDYCFLFGFVPSPSG